jgi:hypothetical protein
VPPQDLRVDDLAVVRAPLELAPSDLVALRADLGRPPRGVVGIAARCVCLRPIVARTAPRLPDGQPFPTTFYLTSPVAVAAISTLEAGGTMAEMNARLLTDPALSAAHRTAHEDYLARRAELGEAPEIAGVSAGGMPTRVKCLHALAAHALAVGPGINRLGDEALLLIAPRWRPDRCACPRGTGVASVLEGPGRGIGSRGGGGATRNAGNARNAGADGVLASGVGDLSPGAGNVIVRGEAT